MPTVHLESLAVFSDSIWLLDLISLALHSILMLATIHSHASDLSIVLVVSKRSGRGATLSMVDSTNIILLLQ